MLRHLKASKKWNRSHYRSRRGREACSVRIELQPTPPHASWLGGKQQCDGLSLVDQAFEAPHDSSRHALAVSCLDTMQCIGCTRRVLFFLLQASEDCRLTFLLSVVIIPYLLEHAWTSGRLNLTSAAALSLTRLMARRQAGAVTASDWWIRHDRTCGCLLGTSSCPIIWSLQSWVGRTGSRMELGKREGIVSKGRGNGGVIMGDGRC